MLKAYLFLTKAQIEMKKFSSASLHSAGTKKDIVQDLCCPQNFVISDEHMFCFLISHHVLVCMDESDLGLATDRTGLNSASCHSSSSLEFVVIWRTGDSRQKQAELVFLLEGNLYSATDKPNLRAQKSPFS